MQSKNIQIAKLEPNEGQIKGLPKNPRFIRDERFKSLVKSIEDDPEMLALRECIVYPNGTKFVVIAGNMRYRACLQLGYKDIPCKVLSKETPVEKLRAYTIKDNISFGSEDWDLLANEWEETELKDFGMQSLFSSGHEANNLTDEDVNIDNEFDPVGIAKGLTRIVVLHKDKRKAARWIKKYIPNSKFKIMRNGTLLIMDLSGTYGK